MIAIVDYGIGNLMAIQNIIKKAGGNAIITSNPATIIESNKLILPGVGSFSYGMQQLNQRNLIPLLNQEVIEKKKIVLGLCLGAQLMTKESEEGGVEGLGWINALTVKFDGSLAPTIPHMSWSDVKFTKTSLTEALEEEARFYFVHSYHFQFSNSEHVIGTSRHGYEFACAFKYENIYGVQFHPEKSHRFGVKLFENFLKL